MPILYQKIGLYVGVLWSIAAPGWAADAVAVVPTKPQLFQTQSTKNTLLEIFQSEADAELPWGTVALSKVENNPEIVPVVWHVQWKREPGWPDPFARDFSDRRQLALVAENPANARFTPQAFLNGNEWRGLLDGARPKMPEQPEVGQLNVEIFPSGAIDVTFKPGKDFRHIKDDVSAHLVRLIEPESRKIPTGPAKGVIYDASHSVIDYQRATYEPRRKHWRLKVPKERLWPDEGPEPRLVIWLESNYRPRPIQVIAVQVKPKPPPPPVEE